MTQEDKQLIAEYMGWIKTTEGFYLNLNDASLVVQKMEANGDADEFELYFFEKWEKAKTLNCQMVWSYSADNFFNSLAAFLRKRGEKMNHEHLCDMCLDEFPTCVTGEIVFGIDRDPSTAFTKDADKVLECENYRPYLSYRREQP